MTTAIFPHGIRHFLIRQSLSEGHLLPQGSPASRETRVRTRSTLRRRPSRAARLPTPSPCTRRRGGGSIDAADDVDYFSITVTEPTYVAVRTVSDTIYLDGALLDSNSSPVQPDFVQGAYRT